MHDIIVSLQNLQVGYGKKTVLDDINFHALKGQMVCLLGPNGAGKTTILRTISGHLKPISGNIFINGDNLDSINKKQLSKILSIVLTERIEPGLFTAGDIVAFGRHPHINFFGKLAENDRKIVNSSLETVDALELQHRYYSTLSDGEKQKIMIARALCQRPQLMILDEPTSHLDVKNRIEVLTILRKMTMQTGITAIISLHDVDLALKTCDIVVLIGDGKILDWGSPEKVVGPNTITKLYNITSAGYNNKIGCLELLNNNEPRVYIIGGNSSAVVVMRLLSKLNIGFHGGILNANDLDAIIAKTMGCEYIVPDNSDSLALAKHAIDACEYIICKNDSGLYADEIMQYAQSMGKNLLNSDSEIGFI